MIFRTKETAAIVVRPRITPDPSHVAALQRRMSELNYQPQNGFLQWIEKRLPIGGLIHSSFVAYPTPLFDSAGQLTGAVNVLMNLTYRHSTHEQLRSSEARYRAIFDNVQVSVFEVDFSEVLDVLDALRADGVSSFRSFWFGQLSAFVEPLAAMTGAALVVVAAPILPYALSFAAGAMIG